MGKINILDSACYNQISAGEVVENPASVLKELVENSIDAGAGSVTVMIEDGGIKSIRVIDDGEGIAEDDMLLSVMPHATSKIASASDLFTVSTLGFRGEALASIAAVSNIEIKSKYISSGIARKIVVRGGELEENTPCALEKGTSITVSNLFFNTPARYKFLKTKKSEEKSATDLIADIILSNTSVAVKYYVDGELHFDSPGNGLFTALQSVYDKSITENVLPLEFNDGRFKLTGYISAPATLAVKPNRSFQTLIINGRLIDNSKISASVQNAYGEALMKRTFPAYALELIMPFELVDINVHPNKKEVRFANENQVCAIFYNAVKSALADYYNNKLSRFSSAAAFTAKNENLAPSVSPGASASLSDITVPPPAAEETTQKSVPPEKNMPPMEFNKNRRKLFPEMTDSGLEHNEENIPENSIPGAAGSDIQNRKELTDDEKYYLIMKNLKKSGSSKYTLREDENSLTFTTLFQKSAQDITINTTNDIKTDKFEDVCHINEGLNSSKQDKSHQIIGQLFDTYILLQADDSLFIIDQHAAHERLLYDKFISEISSGEIDSQPLLIPYAYECGAAFESLLKCIPALNSMGFEINEFGGKSLRITSVPMALCDIDAAAFFEGLKTESYILSGGNTAEIIKEKFAKLACKNAIKGGRRLSDEQLEIVVNYFLDKGLPMQCPHGRPVIIKMTKNEIEKLFRRIV